MTFRLLRTVGFQGYVWKKCNMQFSRALCGEKTPRNQWLLIFLQIMFVEIPSPLFNKKGCKKLTWVFPFVPPVWWGFRSFHNGIYIYIWVLWRVALRSDWKMCHFPTRNGASFLGFVAMASSSSRTRLSKGQELSRAFRGIDGCMDGVKCKGNVETTSTPNISCKIRKNICIYRNTRHPLGVNDKERHIFDFFIATGKSIRKRDASVGDKISWTIS